MKDRSVEQQLQIAETMHSLDMRMGMISALRGVWQKVNFAGHDKTARAPLLDAMTGIVDVASCHKALTRARILRHFNL